MPITASCSDRKHRLSAGILRVKCDDITMQRKEKYYGQTSTDMLCSQHRRNSGVKKLRTVTLIMHYWKIKDYFLVFSSV